MTSVSQTTTRAVLRCRSEDSPLSGPPTPDDVAAGGSDGVGLGSPPVLLPPGKVPEPPKKVDSPLPTSGGGVLKGGGRPPGGGAGGGGPDGGGEGPGGGAPGGGTTACGTTGGTAAVPVGESAENDAAADDASVEPGQFCQVSERRISGDRQRPSTLEFDRRGSSRSKASRRWVQGQRRMPAQPRCQGTPPARDRWQQSNPGQARSAAVPGQASWRRDTAAEARVMEPAAIARSTKALSTARTEPSDLDRRAQSQSTSRQSQFHDALGEGRIGHDLARLRHHDLAAPR